MALIVTGQIVAMNSSDPTAIFPGRVFLRDDGFIEAVTDRAANPPSGFAGTPEVDVGDAFVLPGLIDLHNHIAYNALPLWAEASQKKPFLHHNDWPNKPSYKPDISWSAWILAKAAPEALLAYVQARALVGGTTAVQGWPTFNRAPKRIVRDIDDEGAGTSNRNLVYTSTITETPEQLAHTAQSMSRGCGFIYHCAEGQPGSVVAREFTDVASAGCLSKKLIAIHCNAVSESDWQRWNKSDAGAVVWSPFSNLWLYGVTTDITAVQKQGISICLGSDWGPSGTKHVLGEVKVAKLVSQKLGFNLSDQQLVAMMTCNPGDILSRCWPKQIGRLVPESFGDVTVLRSRGGGDTWKQILEARESDVMLVVVNGKPVYGDANAMAAAKATQSTDLTIRGKRRKIVIPDPEDGSKAFEWTDICGQLEAVRRDPAGAMKKAEERSLSVTASRTGVHAPLELGLDMPAGGAMTFAGPPPDPANVTIPPLPTLVHDKGFFKDIHGRGFHGGLLDGLSGFYEE